jgi:hypothetical protein
MATPGLIFLYPNSFFVLITRQKVCTKGELSGVKTEKNYTNSALAAKLIVILILF